MSEKAKKIVYICSPLRGEVELNTQKTREYCRSAVESGVIPIAPHLLFTQFMDDSNLKERAAAIYMGLELLKITDEIWVCGDVVSDGMSQEIAYAEIIGKPVVQKFCEPTAEMNIQM